MKRWILPIIIVASTLSTLGCSMCCGPYDYDYPNFDNENLRVDPTYGRVGSIFSDPNASFTGDSADSNLYPQPDVRNKGDSYRNDEDPLKLDDDLELIDPITDPETLPGPDDDDSTASRLWKRQPLRAGQEWR